MSLLLHETLIGLGEVAHKFPGRKTNRKLHKSTVIRWCLRGTRIPGGRVVKLEHIRAGNKMLTSVEAVKRYIAALSEPPPADIPPRTPTQRGKAHARADAELRRIVSSK